MILAGAVRDVHVSVGLVVIVLNALAGVWMVLAHYRPETRHRLQWPVVIVAQVSIFVQALLGVILQNIEDLEPNDFHYLYGFTMIVAVGILYGYRQQMLEHQYLLYGGGCLFLMGMAIRAMFIGGPAVG